PVLLNRAPTLHRLGIQAFEPVLALVCTAFNADCDGDQMAGHIPLSPEAQIAPAVLMLSSNNILSPAHGAPIAIPSQDIVLGCYYLTKAKSGARGEGRAFGNPDDVMLAVEAGELETLSPIRLRYTGDLQDLTASRDDQDVLRTEVQTVQNKIVNTTVGRVILNQSIPHEMPFINGLLKKKGLQQLVQSCYLKFGLEKTVEMLDSLKNVGFTYATRSGLSIGIDDLVIPKEKAPLVAKARDEVIKVESQYLEGAITNGERYNKVIAIWSEATEDTANAMFSEMEQIDKDGRQFNPVYIMADSGARGSKQQIRQLAGMRGLMAKPSGEIIESPITANFREGLTVMEYFISTHGARKGQADGVIAAQSIGEPGTQLTMRTFHIGGTASRVSEQSTLEARNAGTARFQGLQVVEAKDGKLVVMNRSGSLVVQDAKGRDRERYPIVYGARLKVKEGQHVEQGQVLVEWDPYTFSILTEEPGQIRFKDILEGITVHEEVDEVTGLSRLI